MEEGLGKRGISNTFKSLPIVLANHPQAPTLAGHVSQSPRAEPAHLTIYRPGLGITSTSPAHIFSSASTAHLCLSAL